MNAALRHPGINHGEPYAIAPEADVWLSFHQEETWTQPELRGQSRAIRAMSAPTSPDPHTPPVRCWGHLIR